MCLCFLEETSLCGSPLEIHDVADHRSSVPSFDAIPMELWEVIGFDVRFLQGWQLAGAASLPIKLHEVRVEECKSLIDVVACQDLCLSPS